MVDFLSDLFDQISTILTDLWTEIAPLVAIALLIVAIIFTPTFAFIDGASWAVTLLSLAGAWLADPSIVTAVIEALGKAVASVIGAVVTAVSSGLGLPGLLLIGGLAYVYFKSGNGNSNSTITVKQDQGEDNE